MVGTIIVTPEQLIEKGTELNDTINALKTNLSEIKNIIDSSRTYWAGIAGDDLREHYSNTNQELLEVLARLTTYPADLEKMAGVYIGGDRQAIQMAEALPDVLE